MNRQSRLPRLILTRPRAQSERFASNQQANFEICIAPLFEIAYIGRPDINGVDAVILTSENGARSQASLAGLIAFCVGPRTADVANARGAIARTMGGTAETLVETLSAEKPDGHLVHLRGKHARGDVAARLTAAGLHCDEQIVYEQVACLFPEDLANELASGSPDILPLFSPRSAQYFAAACPSAPNATLMCLSEAVAAELDESAYAAVEICAAPNGKSMEQALSRRAASLRLEGPAASS